jgi:hypothetical protein
MAKLLGRLAESQAQKRALLLGYAEGPRSDARNLAEEEGSA